MWRGAQAVSQASDVCSERAVGVVAVQQAGDSRCGRTHLQEETDRVL